MDVSVLKQHSFSREFSPLCGPLQFASLSGACSVEHSKVTKFRKGRESSTEVRAEIVFTKLKICHLSYSVYKHDAINNTDHTGRPHYVFVVNDC